MLATAILVASVAPVIAGEDVTLTPAHGLMVTRSRKICRREEQW